MGDGFAVGFSEPGGPGGCPGGCVEGGEVVVGLSFGGAADTGSGDEEGHEAKVGGLVGLVVF
jgi:hypothetical protein